ncbi:MAG TPA: hypothetical protein VI387_10710, partial [Candidatus Brocadiales bacterium]|nr:hypothetical protein [Candidatus Brocadiales bacterium]
MNRFTALSVLLVFVWLMARAQQPIEKGEEFSDLILSGSVFSVNERNEILNTITGAELFLLDAGYTPVIKKISNGLGQYAFLLKENSEYIIIIRFDGFQSQRVKLNTLSSESNHTEQFDFRLNAATSPEHLSTNIYLTSLLEKAGRKLFVESTLPGTREVPAGTANYVAGAPIILTETREETRNYIAPDPII